MIRIVLVVSMIFTANIPILYGQRPPYPKKTLSMSVVDSAYVKISYAFNATDIKNYQTYDDWQLLEIGSRQSKYYSFFVYNCDSLVTDYVKKNPNAQSIPSRMGISGKDRNRWSEYYYSEYFKDFTKNTYTEYARMPEHLEKANACYTEALPVFDWEILTDTLTVMTYLCQKATCHFRGRDFVAWFTLDIPINNGPWKFGGLPGLILKVSDTEKRCDFECIGIEYSKPGFPIKKYLDYAKYQEKDRQEILKYQKESHENYHKMAGLISGDFIDGKFVSNNKPHPRVKYEPIELE
jgi:GLPGLI family protein